VTRRLGVVGAAALVAAAPCLFATEGAEPGGDGIEEHVEVRAERPDSEDVAAFTTTLDTSEIGRRGEDLADALRRVPGARVRDYGGLGSYATVSMRASTSEQVTVLVDGVPQNRALGGPVDLSSIPATQIEQVTVYRGFGPAAFGLGGIGGVVDVRTRAPDTEPQVQVDLLAGELDSRRVSSSASLNTGSKGALRIGAELLRSDGDFLYLDTGATPFNPADDVERRRDNNDVEQTAVLLQQAFDAVGPGRLRIALRAQRRDRGVAGVDSLPSATARLAEDLDDLTLSWSHRAPATLREIDLRLDGFRHETHFRDPDGDIGLSSQDETTRLDGGGLVGATRLDLGSHRALARIDLRAESAAVRDRRLEVQDRGGAERTLFGITLEDTWTLGRWIVAPSLRYEYRDDDFKAGGEGTLPPPAEDQSDGAWSGKVGVAHGFSPRWSLRGSVGRFYRNPSLLELFGDRGSLVGNPALLPERGEALELGAAYRAGPSRVLELVGFARRTDDLIRFVEVSQGIARPENIAESEVHGVELLLALALDRGLWRGLGLDLGATLQRTEDRTPGPSQGKRLPYQPETLGYLGIDWQRGGFTARWDITYTGENSIDRLDTPVFRIPERWIHDLLVSYRWRRGPTVGLDVRNVFDRQTRDLGRFPLPDRVLFVHVGWRVGGTPS
jgi:iron complex outermembrane receptor protein